MTPTDRPDVLPILYSYVDIGDGSPNPDARWAVRVQSGEDDPEPTVVAYARSETIAKRLVLALKRSYGITQEHARESARFYAGWLAGQGEQGEGD
jgi:ABC-type nitrate/sulfonate/bicarbonate transport system substrate-binding protein